MGPEQPPWPRRWLRAVARWCGWWSCSCRRGSSPRCRSSGCAIDLTPLVVAFVGLQCGSLAGAAAGFGIGLLVDLTLVQTLGLTSLIFTVIGYGAGRLRELRDPRAALTPLLVGAALPRPR